jgi:hypothetical protein
MRVRLERVDSQGMALHCSITIACIDCAALQRLRCPYGSVQPHHRRKRNATQFVHAEAVMSLQALCAAHVCDDAICHLCQLSKVHLPHISVLVPAAHTCIEIHDLSPSREDRCDDGYAHTCRTSQCAVPAEHTWGVWAPAHVKRIQHCSGSTHTSSIIQIKDRPYEVTARLCQTQACTLACWHLHHQELCMSCCMHEA